MNLIIWQLILILTFFAGCNSEYRIYKRVGGDHLHLSSNEKELYWFNGMHGNDPGNPMFADIRTELKKFNPDAVLVEGHANLTKITDELSAIKSGENVYVAFLANQNNIACFDIEPPDSVLNNYLVGKYGKKDVLTMYLIRQMIQWKRNIKKDIDFDEYAVRYVAREDQNIGFFKQEITLDLISALLRPHTNVGQLNNENWFDFDAKNYLYFSENRINEVYQETVNYRNRHLVEVIKQKLNEYNRVFVMMGFDHAIEMKKDLYKIFDTK